MALRITKALAGDPPRSDYTLIAAAPTFGGVPRVRAAAGGSPQRAEAANALMAASLDLYAQLRAAQTSLDRQGGALRAGDAAWAARQGAAVVHFKKAAGIAMLALADRFDALPAEAPGPGRATGPATASTDAVDRAAAQCLGLTGAELAELRAEQSAASPAATDPESSRATLHSAAEALRVMGSYFNRLPAVPLPTAGAVT